MPHHARVLLALNSVSLQHPRNTQGVEHYFQLHPDLAPHLHLFNAENPDVNRRELCRLLQQQDFHGVLTNLFHLGAELHLPHGVRLVSLDTMSRANGLSVLHDQEEAGRMAAAHLLEQKLPHFAFVAVHMGGHSSLSRWRGFRDAVQEAGHSPLTFDNPDVRKPTREINDEILLAWVRNLPKPVGIHTYTQMLALRVVWACQEAGLRIPADVCVVGGSDDLPAVTFPKPEITSLVFDDVRLGYEAMQYLHRLMRGAKPSAKPHLIPPLRLIPRASSNRQSLLDPDVDRIRQWIGAHAHQPITVKDVMSQTALSRRTLERRFASLVGHGLADEITAVHMHRAQTLIRETMLPLSQIAAQSGFDNYVRFSVTFRRFAGMAPSTYRQRGVHQP